MHSLMQSWEEVWFHVYLDPSPKPAVQDGEAKYKFDYKLSRIIWHILFEQTVNGILFTLRNVSQFVIWCCEITEWSSLHTAHDAYAFLLGTCKTKTMTWQVCLSPDNPFYFSKWMKNPLSLVTLNLRHHSKWKRASVSCISLIWIQLVVLWLLQVKVTWLNSTYRTLRYATYITIQ